MRSSKKSKKTPNASSPRLTQQGKTSQNVKKPAKTGGASTDGISPLAKLCSLNPSSIRTPSGAPAHYLNVLLPKRKRLKCLGTNFRNFRTALLSEFPRRLSQFSYVVPAYMTSRSGTLKHSLDDGTQIRGPRTNANTDQVLFVVFQSETLDLNEQAEAVLRLRSSAPLVMVTQVGPDRIEAWYSTRGMEKPEIHKFRRFAKFLGAPVSVFIDAHPYALPGGTDAQGFRTMVILWNPAAI